MRLYQADNDTAIMGNVAGQLNFGRFIRLCLNLRITPIFIPEGEPYHNGLAENVISLFAKKVWHKNYFKDKNEMHQAMIHFSDSYCQRLARKKNTLPLNHNKGYESSLINDNKYLLESLTTNLLPKSTRRIIFSRAVKECFEYNYSFINIMGRHIEIPKKYTGFYVAAIYNVYDKYLKIYIKNNIKLLLIKKIKLIIKM